ncbi:MAG TPA: 4-hydroxy-tetrahydrodipicolinate synthase [Acidobacteriaceae bacterium]|jgi:4-hydroxy-tetrahydrodipicolinate synthase|nr:4-hydroxy-tetrahydrodipicolinate synthase [Acidobacteriaceae bacterium]
MNLQGCGTALVTPFREDGKIDERALYDLARWQVDSGIDWLVACGTTAETPTLDDGEWIEVIRIVAEAAGGRVPVWAGCSHNATRQAVGRARAAAQVPGVTAILTANPWYNKPTQEGQYQHFLAVAHAVKLPVVLYNIPSRSGVNLEPATVVRLIDGAPNIEAIKESSGSLVQITDLLTQAPRNFRVFSGDDGMTLGVLGVGGSGLVSVVSNIIPAEMGEMVRAALANDWSSARRINRKYFRLMQGIFKETSPGPAKAILAMMGKLGEHYRLPMVPVSASTRAFLERLAGELGLLVHGPQVEGDLHMY